jgi:hypothetical protein
MYHRVVRNVIVLMTFLTVLAPVAAAKSASSNAGFLTDQPPMLSGAVPNVTVKPILTVGDVLPNGYRFEALPDGVAVDGRGTNRFDVYVNHETSTVPFRGLADFDNAQVSHLVMKRGNGKVLNGRFVVPSSANYLRFCSNFLAGAAEGFDRPLLFTNEETSDPVNRNGNAWPPGPDAEQAGVVVAYDPELDAYRTIYGMGRHNHENSVAVPGYDAAVILSGDDTFSAPSSQLYMYMAADADGVWEDEGHLWAFKGDAPYNDYGDLVPGDAVSGSFVPVPDDVADGDQTALEDWSNANNVFQFIRVEDIAYDRRTPNVVYLADTGEPRAIPDSATGRLMRGPSGTQGPYPNGRIFKLVLDPEDPTVVLSLSILIDGDALGAGSAGVRSLIHNPDNLETTANSLMIQEDPGGQNSYAPDDPNGTTARIWRYDLSSGALTVVARVDQSADPSAALGDWESSGIVDASAMFGRGAFLVTVQAHSIFVETQQAGDVLLKREAGQLLLLRVPGS